MSLTRIVHQGLALPAAALSWTAKSAGWVFTLLLPAGGLGLSVSAARGGLLEAATVTTAVEDFSRSAAVIGAIWSTAALRRLARLDQAMGRIATTVGYCGIAALGQVLPQAPLQAIAPGLKPLDPTLAVGCGAVGVLAATLSPVAGVGLAAAGCWTLAYGPTPLHPTPTLALVGLVGVVRIWRR